MSWLVSHPLSAIALLPALSAGAVALSPRRAGRWIALAGTALTLLALMIVPLFAEIDTERELTGGSITMARGLVLELAMDPAARALSRLLGAIAVVVVLLTWERPGGLRRFHAMPMLALCFALLSVFASTPLTIVIGLLLTSASAAGLLWSAGEFPAAARLTGTHAVSAALLMIAVACGLRDGDAWTQASVWLAMVAVFVRLGVPPLHAWVGSAMSAGAWATRLSVLAIVSITSIAALARWPGFMPIRADAISGMAIVGASILLWGVLAASGADRVTQVARGLWVGLIGLLIVQVANHQPQAMLLTAAALIAPIGLALIARSIERRFGHDDLRKLGGLSNAMPSLMAVALPSTFLAASAPGSPGFAATLATMIGSARVIDGAAGVTTLTLIALSYIVLTLAIVRMTRLCFFGPGPVDDVRQHPSDLRWWEIAGVSILLAIALIAGLMPALVLLPGNS